MNALDPTPSVDPQRWGVYGDWLEENGHTSSADRAHAIARGLQRTGGKLYLHCPIVGGKEYFTASCCKRKRVMKEEPINQKTMAPLCGLNYIWSNVPAHPIEKEFVEPIGPETENWKLLLIEREDLIPLFWDKMAEMGSIP